ncbi:MAG: DUF362 domain-containing protein [Armatimonadetes bacterium]|nr:DUF362 domain-containing protein [Armatimonadota bacterium]
MSQNARPSNAYTVRAAFCDYRASVEEIHATLERITAPLDRAWHKLENARTIAIKTNMVWPPERVRRVDDRCQELVDEDVMRGVLRLLRDRTTARIVVADTTLQPEGWHANSDKERLYPLFDEFGVEYIECNDAPFAVYDVPGGGLMFARYQLNPVFKEADAFVSVATLKNHAFMGVTMCCKNLFGLCPVHPDNRPRQYFHHIIRLPFVLADLGRILQPDLNIVDGLVGQSQREWGGNAWTSNALLAGDQVIATDFCGCVLMGHDPLSDWPTPPFRRDRNHLRIASEAGLGPRSLGEIDFQHDLHPPLGGFDSEATDTHERVSNWRRSMCEQALAYAENPDKFREYAGEYVYLQDGNVVHHGTEVPNWSRRDMSGVRRDAAIFLKYIEREPFEEERFGVYEQELAAMLEPEVA